MSRRERLAVLLRERHLDALLLTTASPENLQYATEFHGLEGFVLLTAAGDGFVITDSRYSEAAQAEIAPRGFTIQVPETGGAAVDMLNSLLLQNGIRTLGFSDDRMPVQEYRRLRDRLADCRLESLGSALLSLRACKEACEIDSIIAAQRIAEGAFEDLLGLIRPGMTETALTAELEYAMKKRGSQRPSFDTILISGAKTSMPHGVPGEKTVQSGDFITVDFGAVVNGYHSDMTRTFALGSATPEMQKVYDIVLEAQLAGIEACTAGAACSAVHRAAHAVIADAGYGGFFGHAFGHGVGLEIHEQPSVSMAARQTLTPGMIVTAEPGIYLPGAFGVRIEDMLLIQEDGVQNLTNTPKELLIL